MQTRIGVPCQMWASTTPHDLSSEKNLPSTGNVCTLSMNTDVPWCMTTDPNIIWDYCYNDCSESVYCFFFWFIQSSVKSILNIKVPIENIKRGNKIFQYYSKYKFILNIKTVVTYLFSQIIIIHHKFNYIDFNFEH